MRHLDLFSGIGGFALAVDTVWHETNNEHIFVEWETFPQRVLHKHWPNSLICGDIRQFIANTRSEEPGWLPAQWRNRVAETRKSHCDIITGGFPCQPFSHAGRRQGTNDDRYLWPEMFECVRLFRPAWVIAENVRGLVTWNDGMVLETVCSDLESEGYEVWPLIIPAASVGAPHRRERIWIVAHSSGSRRWEDARGSLGNESTDERRSQAHYHITSCESANTTSDASCSRQRAEPPFPRTGSKSGRNHTTNSWNEDWPSIAARLCTLDDGLPNGLVRPRGWRRSALKAAGNAIVPQVAEMIMGAIKEIDTSL